jgi:hypothetical protein
MHASLSLCMELVITRIRQAHHNALRVQRLLHPLLHCERCRVGVVSISLMEDVCNTGLMFCLKH